MESLLSIGLHISTLTHSKEVVTSWNSNKNQLEKKKNTILSLFINLLVIFITKLINTHKCRTNVVDLCLPWKEKWKIRDDKDYSSKPNKMHNLHGKEIIHGMNERQKSCLTSNKKPTNGTMDLLLMENLKYHENHNIIVQEQNIWVEEELQYIV